MALFMQENKRRHVRAGHAVRRRRRTTHDGLTPTARSGYVRWFDPTVGKWLSQDPSGLAPDTNPYRYCGNAPTDAVDPSGTQQQAPPNPEPPWLKNNQPGPRQLGRLIGGNEPAWLGRAVPTHEFVCTMDNNGVVHTYSWGNEPPNKSSPSRWYRDYPADVLAAQQALMKGGAVLGPTVGGAGLNPYIEEAFKMLDEPGKDSPSNHANGGAFGNCKAESQRLLDLARALQAADQGRLQDRDLLRERAKADAGIKPKIVIQGVPPPGR